MKTIIKQFLLGVGLLGISLVSWAGLQDEIQVYDDSINNQGELGLEWHSNVTLGGPNKTDYVGEYSDLHQWRNTLEVSYGLTPTLEAGLYLPVVHQSDGQTVFAGPRVRLKWIGQRAPEKGYFYGFNVELSNVKSQFEEAQQTIELRPIWGLRNADWMLAVNPVLDYNLRPGYRQKGPSFAPEIKLARTVAEGYAAGFEFYGDVGPIVQLDPLYLEGNTLFLALDVDRKPWQFNVGVGRGFNSQTDGWTIKTIFELPMDWAK